MSIRSLAKNLPADPDNNGWVLGWGLRRRSSWEFIDIYASKDVADAEALRLGPDYFVDYGTHRLGTDEFIGGSKPPK
ncbi:hypothetical protein [Pseudomonas chlororaphis]|uniref:hypothetical protein n=1 Tax=Pseudomonas chlororaphis TaxID=587753 RepID=UPI0009C04244|nr:hypothetical protein [Pseudomonas chlororaphis]MBM0285078.1 hypothetical protein [Pseudomonas chlororaphis]MDO1505751.1 hypothetical protein [Pseudomonas chlororaphis]ORM49785.1 hypothetical protein B6D51_01190 [Pseudomonas chlororaphis subsp. chlororaphis]TWR99062.1 hypothetical protein FJD36_03605 [Pseudomonas chlororaphis subsp. chlororaphis]WDG99769.1 hypothetical protein PUP54_09425 [Pseudomonas chlororaphis]